MLYVIEPLILIVLSYCHHLLVIIVIHCCMYHYPHSLNQQQHHSSSTKLGLLVLHMCIAIIAVVFVSLVYYVAFSVKRCVRTF